jgi:hypothetical protein
VARGQHPHVFARKAERAHRGGGAPLWTHRALRPARRPGDTLLGRVDQRLEVEPVRPAQRAGGLVEVGELGGEIPVEAVAPHRPVAHGLRQHGGVAGAEAVAHLVDHPGAILVDQRVVDVDEREQQVERAAQVDAGELQLGQVALDHGHPVG